MTDKPLEFRIGGPSATEIREAQQELRERIAHHIETCESFDKNFPFNRENVAAEVRKTTLPCEDTIARSSNLQSFKKMVEDEKDA